MKNRTRTIRVDALTRVEGEGGLLIRLEGREAKVVELRIFEPPRLFEGFLRGRSQMEVPDLTARICGICPVAYQMSSCHAIEDALDIVVGGPLRTLRRLLYCGEWIESHALHVFMLHAPDFLGYPDALAMAKDHPAPFRRGLRIKKTGNAIMELIGARPVHPVNVRVGGFYRSPTRAELRGLLPEIEWSLRAIRETLDWVSDFSFPELARDYELVALRHASEYPFCEGRVVSNRGLDVSVREYGDQIVEEQVPYSTALHAQLRGRGAYLCGPLARINLNFDRLFESARDAARSVGFEVPCTNPFRSILARTIEILQALDEARRIIETYVAPDPPFVDVPRRRATGHGATEAPRGLLYHRYSVDEEGTILDARIVPPTSQNQGSIERDLFEMAGMLADLPQREATRRAEHAIRNHDPCISCATHFLTLRIERQ